MLLLYHDINTLVFAKKRVGETVQCLRPTLPFSTLPGGGNFVDNFVDNFVGFVLIPTLFSFLGQQASSRTMYFTTHNFD